MDTTCHACQSCFLILLLLCPFLPEHILDQGKFLDTIHLRIELIGQGVPVEHIFLPFTFAIGILLLDEGRKFMIRRSPRGILARIAW